MPSTIDQKFQTFIVSLGLRGQIAEALWKADIRSPQELAGYEHDDLQKITNNPLLLKQIHPVLQKYIYNIAMAKDPYKKAVGILKKHTVQMDSDEDEPMDTGTMADSTSSDAYGFRDDTNVTNGRSSGSANPPPNRANHSSGETSFNNRGVRMNTGGNSVMQSRIGYTTGAPNKSGVSLNISGGNFVQSNIMGQGPVTYNNKNTTITTSLDQNVQEETKKRRATRLNTTLWLDGTQHNTADLQFNDRKDFWVDQMKIPTSDFSEYEQHFQDEDVYEVRNHGSCRALILNNIEFQSSTGMSRREGANVDCTRIAEMLSGLGFRDVVRQNNKTEAEMRELLKVFARHRDNARADMILVYIGSHGERDEQGNDTFVGTDGGRIKLQFIRDLFSPKNSPSLVKKPKIFLFQFCRQDHQRDAPVSNVFQTATPVQPDCNGFVDTSTWVPIPQSPVVRHDVAADETREMDMLFVFATLAGTKAYRDTADGSWFVTAIIKVFLDHANKDDVLSMLTKVNNCVSLNEGKEGRSRAVQVSEVVHTLRKKIKFFPLPAEQ